ncbi:unnamed protein product [Malus baccata var. baccata]
MGTHIVCPWGFLAETVMLTTNMPPHVHLSQLPTPVVRGDKTYVKISEDLYQEQLKLFQNNLLGCLLLKNGSTPMKTGALKSCLEDAWRPTAPWNLVPIGKGYFDIHFNKEDDMRRAWGGGTCTLATGLFRLSKWTPDFKPGDVLPQTHAQVWIKIFCLSQEYWHPRHLMEIARGVGTPLQLDSATRERQYGYYARILVDVNLADDLPTSLMVERESHGFPVEVVYENLPPKCSHCGLIRHLANSCRQLKQMSRGRSRSRTRKGGNMGDNKTRDHSRTQLHMEYRPKIDTTIPVNVFCGLHASEPLQQVDQLLHAGIEAVDDGNDEPILQSPLGITPIVSGNVIPETDTADTHRNKALEPVVDEALGTIAQAVNNSEFEEHGIQSPGISHISNSMTGSLSPDGSHPQNGLSYGQHLGNTNVPNILGPHDLCDDSSTPPGFDQVETVAQNSQHLGNTDVPNNFGMQDPHDNHSIPPGFEHVATLAKDVIDIVNHIEGYDMDGFTHVLSNSQKKKQKQLANLNQPCDQPYPSRVRGLPARYK